MEIFTRRARFTFRLLVALAAKYYLAILFGFALSLGVVYIRPYVVNWVSQRQKVDHIAVVGRFTQAEIPVFMQKQISWGLTTLAGDGSPQPAIAKSWEIRDEGKTYVFTLNNNLHWHDGTLIDSEDVKYNFRDVVIDYPDSQHLVVRLKESFAPLLVAVAKPVFKKGLIGVGEYQVQKIRKNGQYLETLTLAPKNSHQPRVVYHFYVSNQQAQTAFKLGLIHKIENVDELGEFVKWPNVTITTKSQDDQYIAAFLNTTHLDKNLRLALAYATNKAQWANRVYGPLASNSWAYTADVKKYDYDLARAKQLLKKAEKVPEKLTINTSTNLQPVAESLKTDWQLLGLNIDTQIVDTIPENYQILLTTQTIPVDPDQYNLWHSTRSTNLAHLDNKRLDRFLELGRTKTDQNIRRQIYQDFQRFLLEEVPAIFLFHPTVYTINRN